MDIVGGLSGIFSALSRLAAFISSVIVAGILGRFLDRLDDVNLPFGSKLTYVIALSGLSIFFSLLLMAPFKFSFWAFPLDFAFFVMWMVAFGLLTNLSRGCGGSWHRNIWSFAWGSGRCDTWRTLLAFTFIASIMWLINCLLGLYKTFTGEWERTNEHQRLSRGSMGEQPMTQAGAGNPNTYPTNTTAGTTQPASTGNVAV